MLFSNCRNSALLDRQNRDQFAFILKSLGVYCWLLIILATSPRGWADEPIKQLRVLTYNIHHGRGMDGRVDLERIAKIVVDSKADLVALQEVDNKTQRTGGIDQTAQLAKLTGLHGRFAKAIDFEGGQYGQALLTRWPITSLEVDFLPVEPNGEKRMIVKGSMEIDGRELQFCTVHLHHADARLRLLQAQTINRNFRPKSATTTIVAGDLNAEPDSPTIQELSQYWTFPNPTTPLLTFPATAPSKQIDYILYRPVSAVKVLSINALREPVASDHQPILAVIELIEQK